MKYLLADSARCNGDPKHPAYCGSCSRFKQGQIDDPARWYPQMVNGRCQYKITGQEA